MQRFRGICSPKNSEKAPYGSPARVTHGMSIVDPSSDKSLAFSSVCHANTMYIRQRNSEPPVVRSMKRIYQFQLYDAASKIIHRNTHMM